MPNLKSLPIGLRRRIVAVTADDSLRAILRFHVSEKQRPPQCLVGSLRMARRLERVGTSRNGRPLTGWNWLCTHRSEFSEIVLREPLPEPDYVPDAEDLEAAAARAWPQALQLAQDHFQTLGLGFRAFEPAQVLSRDPGAPTLHRADLEYAPGLALPDVRLKKKHHGRDQSAP